MELIKLEIDVKQNRDVKNRIKTYKTKIIFKGFTVVDTKDQSSMCVYLYVHMFV